MPNLKEVRNRITSVNSTRQITSAMKLVSAAKLRRAQDAITKMRPYAEKLNDILGNLSQSMEGADSPFMTQRPAQKVLLVLITSNRGLCGAFNTNVMRKTQTLIREKFSSQAAAGQVHLLTIGKKATAWANRSGYPLVSSHDDVFGQLDFPNVSAIASKVMNHFLQGDFDQVVLVYNEFKTAASQLAQAEAFLPVNPSESLKSKASSGREYIFEPGKEEIIQGLIPMTLKIQFFKAVLDSHASEHGARMTAMAKATDNAGELLKSLRLSYNKARQAAITGEILEIVGGAEALNG